MTENEYQVRMAQEREHIDRIDAQLLPLFVERMQCSDRVGEIKRQANKPVLNAQREQEILKKVRAQAGEFGESIAALFREIMAVSSARQYQLLDDSLTLRDLERTAQRVLAAPQRIVCQGLRGAYSHQAARSLFGDAPIEFVPEFSQVFEEVNQGALGVLPVENSAAGSVTAVYDLILQYRFFIVGAVDVRAEHCLAAIDSSTVVTRVVSHPQALSQCSEYIRANGLESMEYSNTAAAARHVAEEHPKGTAAICSQEAAERYGLTILQKGVQNVKNNTTRFVAVSKEPYLPEAANKISLCFSLPHSTGSLYGVLQRFAVGGLNLTKIESRPIPGSKFEYDFYLDFTGNIHSPDTLNLICALNAELPRFSFLGNYQEVSDQL